MNNEGESTYLPLTGYHSVECGNAKNCRYPFTGTGSTPEELRQLFRYDHTLIRFQNNYRSISNFLESATVVLDNDNDHTTDPGKWIPKVEVHTLTQVYIESSSLTNIYFYIFTISFPYGTKDKKDKNPNKPFSLNERRTSK